MYTQAGTIFFLQILPFLTAQGLTHEELEIFTSFGIKATLDYSEKHWLLEHSGLPNHDHGPFPSENNPNSIALQDHDYLIPKIPNWLDNPGCLPLGTIAMSKSGIPFYNPYTGQGLNAIGNEVFDDCEGHPDPSSTYHYHQLPSCLYEGGNNELMGVALDGYPIFGPKDENGNNLTTADLDFCHGRWYNGRYQYHITYDFPYVMSCFRGESTTNGIYGNDTRPPPPGIGDRPPPPGGEDGPPPPPDGEDGGNLPPPGMMRWTSCFAFCENPGEAEDSCMEPEYDPLLHDSRDTNEDPSGARSLAVTGVLLLTAVLISFV